MLGSKNAPQSLVVKRPDARRFPDDSRRAPQTKPLAEPSAWPESYLAELRRRKPLHIRCNATQARVAITLPVSYTPHGQQKSVPCGAPRALSIQFPDSAEGGFLVLGLGQSEYCDDHTSDSGFRRYNAHSCRAGDRALGRRRLFDRQLSWSHRPGRSQLPRR